MTNPDFYISTDNSRINKELVYQFLCERTDWAKGRSKEVFEKSIEHSLCFSVYTTDHQQAGFARVVTDYAVYAYILDLFVLELWRGKGLSKLLMQAISECDKLRLVGNWGLRSKDARSLYAQFGFVSPKYPERMMERWVY